jgi:alkyl sulfatase BDS1-like metallo-beta-lactamase superfamily hydrolase
LVVEGSGDFERAGRGLVARHANGVIEANGSVVYDVNRYSFITAGSENPETVHPAL